MEESFRSWNVIHEALRVLSNGKAPGNDGLTADFYKGFWDLLGHQLTDALNYSYQHGELSNSQKQAIIRSIDKRRISLLKC